MTSSDEEKFRKAYNIRRCEKCCGNCKHFDRDYEESGCAHPKQAEFDSFLRERDSEFSNFYDAYFGTEVDEGNVCDLWELKTRRTK